VIKQASGTSVRHTSRRRAITTVLAASALAALWAPAGALAAWEPAQEIDVPPSGETLPGASLNDVIAPFDDVAVGANGLTTAQFWQKQPGGSSNGNTYMARRPAAAGWGSPQSIALPAQKGPGANMPTRVSADPAGDAASVFVNPDLSGVLGSTWPAPQPAPGGAQGICAGSFCGPLAGSGFAPQIAMDAAGNAYAVAGTGTAAVPPSPGSLSPGAAPTDGTIYLATYTAAKGTWSAFAPLQLTGTPSTAAGRAPRIAVGPDGTVVVAYLRTEPMGTTPFPPPPTLLHAARRAPGQASFLFEHQVGGSTSNSVSDFDVAIDGSDNATIADAESPGGVKDSVFSTLWPPGSNPGSAVQISNSLAPAATPRLAANPAGDVTAGWTESGLGSTTTLVSAEFSGGSWTAPVTVSSSGAKVAGFGIADDGAGTATAAFADGGNTVAALRAAGQAWSATQTLSTGGGGTQDSSAKVASVKAAQSDAIWIQKLSGRLTLFASRFSGPPPPPAGPPPGRGPRVPIPRGHEKPGGPVLSGLTLNPSRFRAASRGPTTLAAKASAAKKRKQAKTGTTISYRDSQAARTTFTVYALQKGVRRGKRCVRAPASHSKRTGRAAVATRKRTKGCTRAIAVGSFSHDDRAGRNRLRFTGRLRGRQLEPGAYRLTAAARNSRGRSAPLSRRFRILGSAATKKRSGR
jgi:hypothetical protein